ncbi:MAG: DUF4440 domain-containing protein [Rhodospirillales bacterium]|nr:DUF4440 domain-containing protein [Rhodospirillales bacterium]
MQRYFETYAAAFLAHDAAEIERHFAYPCLIVNQAGADAIIDADELAQHLEGFLATLRTRGVIAVDVQVRDYSLSGPDHATATVAYVLQDAGGETVEAYAYLYVLVKNRAGAWTIRLAELLGPNA